MVHVQRPIMHGGRFDKRWFPSSDFKTRGTKDAVMYHPKYNGPKISVLNYTQPPDPIDEESIFRPPEGEEWIKAYSEKRTLKKEEMKNKAKKKQVDSDPFDTSQMKPYHDNTEHPTANKEVTSEKSTKWGRIQSEPQSTINKWQQVQQGHMTIEEVAGEARTPGAVNPKFKIPKFSEKKEITADKLNELAASISPPAKEGKKEAPSTTQPHKNKKGQHYGHISGTRKSRGGSRK